ncbi:hypothetical protein GJ496_003123, partial [Pomphorhynchus laevis]
IRQRILENAISENGRAYEPVRLIESAQTEANSFHSSTDKSDQPTINELSSTTSEKRNTLHDNTDSSIYNVSRRQVFFFCGNQKHLRSRCHAEKHRLPLLCNIDAVIGSTGKNDQPFTSTSNTTLIQVVINGYTVPALVDTGSAQLNTYDILSRCGL